MTFTEDILHLVAHQLPSRGSSCFFLQQIRTNTKICSHQVHEDCEKGVAFGIKVIGSKSQLFQCLGCPSSVILGISLPVNVIFLKFF